MSFNATDATRQIHDRFAILDLMARYCHLVDSKNTALVADQIFTADAVLDYGYTRRVGRDEIHAFYTGFDDVIRGTAHILANPLVEIDGDNAIAMHRVLAIHWHRHGNDDTIRAADEMMTNAYQDRLRREAGGWRVRERTIVQYGCGLAAGTVTPAFEEMLRGFVGKTPRWPF